MTIMKQFLLILAANLLALSAVLATEQKPDILIIGKDTIYLKSFPLEDLRTRKKNFKPLFDDGFQDCTGCWRGYIATWQIIDGFLTLTKVESFFSKNTLSNIAVYLKNTGYYPKTINGYVIADWYTDTLKSYESVNNYAANDKFYIGKDFSGRNDKLIELGFENGKVIKNNISPIEDYKIGDKLSFYYSQSWRTELKGVTIHGVIRENNGKMVRLEILSFSANGEDITNSIKKEIINGFDNFWINPRYCEKIE